MKSKVELLILILLSHIQQLAGKRHKISQRFMMLEEQIDLSINQIDLLKAKNILQHLTIVSLKHEINYLASFVEVLQGKLENYKNFVDVRFESMQFEFKENTLEFEQLRSNYTELNKDVELLFKLRKIDLTSTIAPTNSPPLSSTSTTISEENGSGDSI